MKLYANAKNANLKIDHLFFLYMCSSMIINLHTLTFPDVIFIFTGYRRAPNICHVWISLWGLKSVCQHKVREVKDYNYKLLVVVTSYRKGPLSLMKVKSILLKAYHKILIQPNPVTTLSFEIWQNYCRSSNRASKVFFS